MSTRGLTQNLLAIFFCHWIATLGVAITSASAIVFLGFQFQAFTNPYYSLVIFLAVPALFLGGLTLIPVGLYVRSRQLGGYLRVIELTEWDGTRVARLAVVILAATLINITLLSAATYEGRSTSIRMHSAERCVTRSCPRILRFTSNRLMPKLAAWSVMSVRVRLLSSAPNCRVWGG